MSNNVTLIGNLTMDPELRFLPNGTAMARIGVAVNRRWMRDGEWQEDTDFFYGTVWSEQAESAAESLQKGTRVILSGRLNQRTWETNDGEKREAVEVRIDEIGPSLRWATATVNKTQRSDGDFGGGGATKSVPPAPVARDDYGPDEAPF
ncbi:MAG: single-stranded DNA-binding protein [Acidimicrobiia bacterium]